MWFSLVLALIVGANAVTNIDNDQQGAWKTGREYKYLFRSYTTTALGQPNKPLNNQISGFVINAILTIQVRSPETLIVNFANVQYAQVQKVLPDGIESIPDDKLSYQKASLIGENFTIRLKDGVIEELEVDSQTPVWQVNLQKSIASQLQFDTRGKNEIPSEGAQLPTAESPFGLYKVLEQSIGGNCEVQYDIAPLIDQELRNIELLPNPTLVQNNELVIDIKKIKNYQNCKDLKIQSININKEIASKIASRLSTTRAIVSGNLKSYTILSSITTSNIYVSLSESAPLGTVVSKSKITLQEKREIRQPIVSVGEFTRIKDLTYSFKCATDPVTLAERDPDRESVSSSSSEKITSRENDKKTTVNDRTTSEENPDLLKGSFINEQLPTKLNELPKIPTLFDCAAKQLTGKQKVNKVRALIQEVIVDFERNNRDLSVTPSKYLLVVKLMRTLNLELLKELTQQLQEDNAASAKAIAPKVTALKILYDALAQAGTGPALLLIKRDIKENQLQDSDAARVIKQLDTAVRLLTKEYVEAVCDMLEDPEVAEKKALKRTVPLVCGKILRRAARSSSKLISDSDVQELLSKYIFVMKQKLRESILNNDIVQAYALVLGLGNTGDPRIISILEPYLERAYVDSSTLHDKKIRDDSSEGRRNSETGKIQVRGTLRSKRHPSSEEKNDYSEEKEIIVAMNGTIKVKLEVSKPLRTLMVMMVGEVIRHNPSKYRSIALKLYLNPQESPEIRCIAAHSYIMSNPSLIDLMRIAKFVNINSNKEVSSCVKSSLINAANEESTSLQTKARTVFKFVDPETIEDNATKMLSDFIKEAISRISFINTNKIFSSAYLRMEPHHLHSDMQMTTLAYDVSNLNVFMRDMQRILERIMSRIGLGKLMTNKPMQPQAFTQIIQELKIKPVNNKLEGFVYVEILKSILYSFDDSTLDEDLKKLQEILLENHPYTLVHMSVYDRMLSFPVETGLPFVFTQEIPSVTLIDTAGKEEQELSTIRGKFNVIHSSKLQNTIAVVTPCDHQQYVSGTDNTLLVVAPLTFEVKAKEVDNETQFNVKLSPSHKLSATDKVLLYSNTPYTSINNILELKPILLSENTHPVQVPCKLKKNTFDLELFRLTTETDASSPIQNFVDDLYNLPSLTNYNIAIQPKSDVGPKQEATFTVVYATENIKEDDESSQKDGNPAQEDLETTPKDLPSLDKTPNSKLRRQQFMARAKSVVKSANLQVVDVSLRIPASGDTLARDYVFTTILVNRLVNNTIHKRICAYFNRQTEDKNIELEVGLIGIRNFELVRTGNLNQAIQKPPEDKYFVNVAWKKQNEEEKRFKLEAIQSQSASLKQAIQNSNAVQQCLKALNTGDTRIQACRESAALVNKKDNLKVSVTYNPTLAKELRENTTFERAFGYLYVLSPRYINTVNTVYPKYADKNFVEMEVKAPLYAEQMDVTLYTPKADVTLSTPKQSGQTLSRFFMQVTPTCSLSKDELITFDNVHRPVNIGKCFHVMATTIEGTTELVPLVLVKRDVGSGLVVIVVTNTGKRFKFRYIDRQFVVSLGSQPIGTNIKPSNKPVFDERDIQIFSAPNYLKLVTKDGNLEVAYFGGFVDVLIPERLHHTIAGLCGTVDNVLYNDYRVQPCHLSPEEYTASFALLSQGCQGPTVFNKQKAVMSLAACSQRQNRPIDIINDREAGRDTGRDTTLPVANPGVNPRRNSTVSKTEDELTETFVEYRTSYYENDASMVCFSTVPVPQCSCGCTPEVTEERHYNFHCMPKTSRTITLMNKIDKGARPDFSARSVSTTQSASYPTKCNCLNPSTECKNPQ